MTFVGSLVFGVQYGIIIGIGVSFLLLLYTFARLGISPAVNNIGSMVPGRDLVFPAADYLETHLHSNLLDLSASEPCYVLDLTQIVSIDFSIAHTLAVVSKDFGKHDKKLLVIAPNEAVRDVLRRTGEEIIFFPSFEEALLAVPEAGDAFGERTRLLRTQNQRDDSIVPISS